MRFVLAIFGLLLSAAAAMAQIDSAPKVQARLIAETGEIAPGGTVAVTLEEQFAAARAKIPSSSPWPISFHLRDTLELFIATPALGKAQLKDVTFFPLFTGAITDFAPQSFAQAPGGLVLHLKPAKKPKI